MLELGSIFERCVEFDPEAELEGFLKQVPGKWVVYLFADEHDGPVQLLCVKNLRASLKRRLSGEEAVGLSKRVDYRQVVRRVYWRRVDSALEADWVYLEAARRVFPQSYQGMVGFRPAWFVHVNPDVRFPRYTKTTEIEGREGEGERGRNGDEETRGQGDKERGADQIENPTGEVFVGPVEDKHSAGRLIQMVEDVFDLCRYYNILVEAPQGKACAYKEMGKCPAPCDGSISMEQYRGMIRESLRTLCDPGGFVRQQTQRMQEAAGALKFELAGRIKAKLEQVGQWGQGAFRHARRLEEFAFLSLQRGPREGTAKVFLITPGQIEEVAGLIGEPNRPGELLRHVLQRAQEKRPELMTPEGVERLGLVAHHLFLPRQTQGLFIRLSVVDEKALAKAFGELKKLKAPEPVEEEGVLKELQEGR